MRPSRQDLSDLRQQTTLTSDQISQVFAEIDALTNAHKNIMIYANDAYIKDSVNASAVTLGKSLLTSKNAVAGVEVVAEKVAST